MAVKVGINGFGRIGRLSLRSILEKYPNEIEVVALNDIVDAQTNAHLFKYDSNYGVFGGEVDYEEKDIVINGKKVYVYSERDPANIPWANHDVDIVIESTGIFTDAEKAKAHVKGSVKKVLITAPAKNEDVTIVLGVNEEMYDPKNHVIISNASCTTNCLAPVAKTIHDKFGIAQGFMTTIHAYTNDQKVQDQAHKDLRRARAAALSMIPTTTGAAKAVSLVIPELKGKMNGLALRVPTPTVSLVDLVMDLEKDATAEGINDALKAAANGRMKGYLGVCDEPLVSVDFKANELSSIVDAPSTMILGPKFAKVLSWYDNEWGYSCRVADLIDYMVKKGL